MPVKNKKVFTRIYIDELVKNKKFDNELEMKENNKKVKRLGAELDWDYTERSGK